METETLLRIVALLVAATLVLSYVDYGSSWNYIKSLLVFKKKPKEETESETEISFLEIVDLWYKLKDKCDGYGLEQAVEKLDEVFPLLNEGDNDV